MVKFFIFSFKKLFLSFCFGIASKSGRNFFGRICVQHRGGGNKLKSLKIDRYRYLNSFGVILKIFKDFYHTGFFGYIFYDNGLSSIILLSEGVKKFNTIFSGNNFNFTSKIYLKIGSTQTLFRTNLFDSISSIETFPFSGSKFVRAAGSSAKIISKTIESSVLKLSSG
jgi:ribosomal protein L2